MSRAATTDLLPFLPLAPPCGLGLRLKTLEPSELAAGVSPDPPHSTAPLISVGLTVANLSSCVSGPCASSNSNPDWTKPTPIQSPPPPLLFPYSSSYSVLETEEQ